MYNIVVDDDKTAQQLLDKGQLRRKYTILPLNKLTARPLDKRVIDHAQNLVCAFSTNIKNKHIIPVLLRVCASDTVNFNWALYIASLMMYVV